MPVDKELLEILCCPLTRVGLKELSSLEIQKLNNLIKEKKLRYHEETVVDQPLQEGLITVDGKRIYRIDDEIPIMLIEKGIPVEGFHL